jgi:type I restriction enzyme S subunit
VVMNEWKETTLGEIAEIEMGQSPKGETCNIIGNGIPLLNGPTEFGIKNPKAIQFTIDSKRLSRPMDILFCVRGSTTGRMNWSDKEYAIGRGLAAIRHKKGIEYRYFLKGIIDYNLNLLLSSATGSTFPNITRSQIEGIEIILPPLPEQKAIASILSSLDDKIDLLHRQNKTLEQMAETLFRQWFVEEAEEDWEWHQISEFVEVLRGLSYKGAGLSDKENGIPMHNLNSVFEGGGYKYEGIKYYSGEYKERHLVKSGDVIITNTEQGHEMLLIGFPAIVPKYYGDNGIFSQHIYKLKLKDSTFSESFLYFLLMTYDVRDQISGATNGSTVNMLPKDGIEWAKFKLPPQNKINNFTKLAKPSIEKIETNYSQIRTLEKLRDTLLPKLMSGEVRVNHEESKL